jgi:hypothetical protein
MDSEWWDYPAYEPCPRRRSGLLGDEEYDYSADVNASQQVPWALPPPEEEEAEEVAISVEEYQPPDLSEEEAIRRAMEESKLLELGLWDGLGTQLQASMAGDRAAPPPPPPPPPTPEPEPQVGWGHAVYESPPHAPPIQVHWGPGWGYASTDSAPSTAAGSGAGGRWVPMVPWPFPWDRPPRIDLTGDDDDDE